MKSIGGTSEHRVGKALSYQEISNVMDLTEVQVKVYLHRARTKIKNKVEEFERYEL